MIRDLTKRVKELEKKDEYVFRARLSYPPNPPDPNEHSIVVPDKPKVESKKNNHRHHRRGLFQRRSR